MFWPLQCDVLLPDEGKLILQSPFSAELTRRPHIPDGTAIFGWNEPEGHVKSAKI